LPCIVIAAAVGGLATAAYAVALRRAVPVATRSRAAALGAVAGCWAGLAVFFFCPAYDLFHLLVGHLLPILCPTLVRAVALPPALRPSQPDGGPAVTKNAQTCKTAGPARRTWSLKEVHRMKLSAPHRIDALGAKIPLSRPGDPGYAAATRIWAAPTIGDGPIAVAHCRNADDVQEALRAARKHDLPISVRAGGHDWAGRALCEGLVIDLGAMRGVTVEARGASVLMGGGALARDVFRVADPIGCAAVTGTVGVGGMGGLTLGGGYGSLIGRFGLV